MNNEYIILFTVNSIKLMDSHRSLLSMFTKFIYPWPICDAQWMLVDTFIDTEKDESKTTEMYARAAVP